MLYKQNNLVHEYHAFWMGGGGGGGGGKMNTARHAMEILPLVVILMVLSMWSFPRNEV